MMSDIPLFLVIGSLLFNYVYFLLGIIRGLKNLSGFSESLFQEEFISVIIPFRNESSNILTSYKKGWSFPSKEKYEALQKIDICKEDYYKLKEIYYDLRSTYLDIENDKYPNVFNLWQGKKYKSNILEYKKDYDGLHPTQKPILLLEDLIKTFSNENDLVVDLTAGSFSTAIACINTKRKFIGIDTEKQYLDLSIKRL